MEEWEVIPEGSSFSMSRWMADHAINSINVTLLLLPRERAPFSSFWRVGTQRHAFMRRAILIAKYPGAGNED
jgi:hypothetical protein